MKLQRYCIDIYLNDAFEKRFYFLRKRDLMWASRMIIFIGPRASFKLFDRWRRREITR